jgi:phenylacetate-coenzyme A ligase PaaK-like adenylate-forming protein
MEINKFHAAYIANGPHKTPKNISVLKKYDPRIITTKPSKTILQNQIQ